MKAFLITILAVLATAADIELKPIDPKKFKAPDLKAQFGGSGIGQAMLELVMKVHFREKHLKKRSIEEIAAELEEELVEAEFEYSNLNIRDGGESVWIMCNDAEERARIRQFLIGKENLLVIESDGKRFFGKFA